MSEITKQDLLDLEQRLDRKLDAVEDRLTTRMQTAIREAVEEIETRIIGAVMSVAENQTIRIREFDSTLDSTRKRISLLEDRMLAVEKKLLGGRQ